MISINGEKIDLNQFPDGTLVLHINSGAVVRGMAPCIDIKWNYENDSECFAIWCITKELRSEYKDLYMILELPYVPNARMDRVKAASEVFTLKWFADFINALQFDQVVILDPHSNVTPALINNVAVCHPERFIRETIKTLDDLGEDVMLCYPDEGASKRYADMAQKDYTFCVKRRRWEDGAILGTTLMDPEKVKDRNVLIVDDICSRGGTFMHTAKALKEAGAEKIYLYVTHCENTIMKGDLLTAGLIEHTFTTNSIFTAEADKSIMTVYEA